LKAASDAQGHSDHELRVIFLASMFDSPFTRLDMPLNYTAFHIKIPFLELDIQRMQNADFGISRHSMDNHQKKEHLMKSGISAASCSRAGLNPTKGVLVDL
jgi:hypothetical protein